MFHCRWVLSPLLRLSGQIILSPPPLIWLLLFNVAAHPGLYSFWWWLLGRRIIFQLEGPSEKVSLLLCAWHEMKISSMMMMVVDEVVDEVVNDDDDGLVVVEERSKQKKKCLFFEGLRELFNKHQTHAKSQRKKSTYTLHTHSTHIKCSIRHGILFWDWSCFLNFHQLCKNLSG